MPDTKKEKLIQDNSDIVNEKTEIKAIIQDDLEFYSNSNFEELEISEKLKKAIEKLNYKRMTLIQAKSIPILLKGRDVIGAAKTGSGKTLAFLIPAIDLLLKSGFKQMHKTGILIITPTRELADQNYNVAHNLISENFNLTYGVITGGWTKNYKMEEKKLSDGVNLLVATPGRLLDHLQNNNSFVRNLVMLIIDEADRILDEGFEDQLNQILGLLPKEKRQTLLFSATMTTKIQDLIRVSLRNPVQISVNDLSTTPTVNTLEQGYVIAEPDKKFLLLYTFLKNNLDKKLMVFFNSCNQVKFFSDLLNYVDIPVKDIHGRQKQQKRISTFYEFKKSEKGILLCTDVAQRGLDIPDVHWIVQFDAPDDPHDYIHRVGRTARAQKIGKALLFLLPSEIGFLRYLKMSKVPLNEYEFPENKILNIQTQYEKLVEKNYYLNAEAKDAYKSYLKAYASQQKKDIFDVNKLDLIKISKSFGLTFPPKVSLSIKSSGRNARKFKSEQLTAIQKSFQNKRKKGNSQQIYY